MPSGPGRIGFYFSRDREIVESFSYAFDFMVISYAFIEHNDLDTRTQMVNPPPGDDDYLGWRRARETTGKVLSWGGDNRSRGKESILLDLSKFQETNPESSSLQLDFRCFWYSKGAKHSTKNGYVHLDIDLYTGGEMIPEGYSFVNPTATDSLFVKSMSSLITQNSQYSEFNGQRLAILNYDLVTSVGDISVIDPVALTPNYL